MAKYKIIPSSRTIVQSPISIGHKAEKGVEAIEFDLTAWVETYGSGTLTVIMRRWGDVIPYPIALEIDENNKATWTLSDIDTAKAGMAYAQLNYIVGDEVVKKSDIYTFRVMDSLTGEGDPPEAYESWLEHLTHLAAEAMAEVLDIEGIVTDKTLTVDGGIADAKKTGDELTAIKANLDAISDPSRLADGTDLNDIMTPGTYALHTAMTYVNSPSSQNEHGILEVWDEIYSGNPYRVFQRITFAYRSDRSYSEIWIRNYSNLSSTWGNWLKVGDDTDSIKSDVATLKTKAKHLAYTRVNLYDSTTAKDDIAIWGDGNEHSGAGNCCSDFIDISAYKNLTIFGTTLICFYNSSKEKISADTGADTRFTERSFEVPVNATYIRISTKAGYKESVYIGDGLVNLTNVKEKHISILFVGNSLTHDSVSYVPYILSTLFPEIDFSIHIFYNGGTTLISQYNRFVNDTPCANYSICENAYTWKTYWNIYDMKTVLETYKFDIVCMQDYFTFRSDFVEADLAGWNNCQTYIATHYTGGNPLKFVTLMPAPVRDNWTSQEHPTTAVVYAATEKAMKMFVKKTVAEAVIPCGMGIYKAMDTELDDLGDTGHLAQDALHCQEGIPCLLQAYIVTLFILGELGEPKSIYASPIRMTATIYDTLNAPGANVGTGVITGTDAQNLLAQEIAIQAHKDVKWWDFTVVN